MNIEASFTVTLIIWLIATLPAVWKQSQSSKGFRVINGMLYGLLVIFFLMDQFNLEHFMPTEQFLQIFAPVTEMLIGVTK